MERLRFGKKVPHNAMEISIHMARYSLAAGLVNGRDVLDIACGEGWGSYVMSRYWGARSVHGVDRSERAIRSARSNFDLDNITWSVRDADRVSPENLGARYDVIISIETIEHLANPKGFLETIQEVLKPNGSMIVSCPNDHWYFGSGHSKNPYHLHTYTYEEFKSLSESVLGPAKQYYMGTPASGFATVPMTKTGDMPGNIMDGLDSLDKSDVLEIAPDPGIRPSRNNALYFLGLWGPKDASPIHTVTPHDSERKFALDHLRPPGVGIDGPVCKMILVADTPGWAYDNICQNVKKYLGDVFEIKIVYVVDYPDYKSFYSDVFVNSDAQFVHFFWREYLFSMMQNIRLDKLKLGMGASQAALKFAEKIITTSIYDHLFLTAGEIDVRRNLLPVVDGYSVCSQRLRGIYESCYPIPADVVIEDGVDLQLFRPHNLERFKNHKREFVVGWTGNSHWHKDEKNDPKGFHSILVPAVKRLVDEGLAVRSEFADVMVSRVPRPEMPGYYSKIDVLVCASSIEGTPNPVLEAMACGVPVVSTDVGIIPELLGTQQKKFILPERSVDSMADTLRQLAENRPMLERLSRENLETIREWTWKHHAPKWMQLFKAAALRHDVRAIHRNQNIVLCNFLQTRGRRGADVQELLKKVAFRIHGDTLFWRAKKYMLKKLQAKSKSVFSAAKKTRGKRN